MALPRSIPVLVGTIAILSTTALLAVHIILARSTYGSSLAVAATSTVSSVLQACVLLLSCWLCSFYLRIRSKDGLASPGPVWLATSALLVTASTVVSVVTMVSFHSEGNSLPARIFDTRAASFLIGSSAILAAAVVAQLAFILVHFVLVKRYGIARGGADAESGGGRLAMVQVKSIPYSQTSPAPSRVRGSSISSRTPPGSSGGRSTAETMSSVRSSLSHVVRPITSKTRLISKGSQRSSHRPASLDSNAWKEPSTVAEDAFDSWDTSAVDSQNRIMVLQSTNTNTTTITTTITTTCGSATKSGHFLETIPASPTTSRSPSPGTPVDLEPPRRPRRSRSYSPISDRSRLSAPSPNFLQQGGGSEAHIHPLFRSDSPTPPPVAKPGTVVTAAPNAGQIIAPDAQSIRRMRSGSLPQMPSPLSHQGSFEGVADSIQRNSLREEDEEEEEEEEEEDEGEEREEESKGAIEYDSRATSSVGSSESEETSGDMSPPIPDWIMTAGTRTSLYGYNSRRASSRRAWSIGEDEAPARLP